MRSLFGSDRRFKQDAWRAQLKKYSELQKTCVYHQKVGGWYLACVNITVDLYLYFFQILMNVKKIMEGAVTHAWIWLVDTNAFVHLDLSWNLMKRHAKVMNKW